MVENLTLFMVVLLADLCAVIIEKAWAKHKKAKIELLKCELCEKPRKLRRTKDELHLACRVCRKLYNDSLNKQKEAS